MGNSLLLIGTGADTGGLLASSLTGAVGGLMLLLLVLVGAALDLLNGDVLMALPVRDASLIEGGAGGLVLLALSGLVLLALSERALANGEVTFLLGRGTPQLALVDSSLVTALGGLALLALSERNLLNGDILFLTTR